MTAPWEVPWANGQEEESGVEIGRWRTGRPMGTTGTGAPVYGLSVVPWRAELPGFHRCMAFAGSTTDVIGNGGAVRSKGLVGGGPG